MKFKTLQNIGSQNFQFDMYDVFDRIECIIKNKLLQVKFFIKVFPIMQQVILQFFQRFRSDITESIYALKGIEDYQKLKTYYDYLDFDRQTIFRDKMHPSPAGLRNIGNTCYLNVFLQILYHINSLRQKIFANDSSKSKVLQQLKYLFGRIQLGKLSYADPTDLFGQLKTKNPQVFIEGVQNDFHQICTLLVDELKQGFKASSENDAKLIEKILFGKLSVKSFYPEGKNLRNTRFNIINLDVSHGNLQKALESWKNYSIDDYMTQDKKIVKASVVTEFIETPALMTFFINRVSFKDNQLVKDNRKFEFDQFIQLQKATTNPTNGPKLGKGFTNKEEQLLEQKQKLNSWIQKIQTQKQTLKQTLKYLEEKEFTNINVPQIENKYEQGSKVKEFLEEEIKLIDAKIQDSQRQILSLENKINKLYEQNEIELYHLWGMMVHQGSTANSGHYKVLLQIDDKWTQFNDKKVEVISQEKLNSYNEKGQVCCLFYKRPALVCSQKKVPITGALKAKVQEIEKNILHEIDNARILQNLYLISESSGFLTEYEMKNHQSNNWEYFFKPVFHCFQEKYSFTQCQGVLTFDNFKDPINVIKLQSSFLTNQKLQIPDLSLQIPIQYFKYAEIFEKFLKKQISLEFVEEAYEWLGQNLTVPVKNKVVSRWIDKYLEIFVMKGIFYLCVFYRLTLNPMIEGKFLKLFKGLEKIMRRLKMTSDFVLTYIPIKDEIQRLFNSKMTGRYNEKVERIMILKPTANSLISKQMIESAGQLFKTRFERWIRQRNVLCEIDQGIINKEIEEQKKYIVELA